MRWLVFVIAIGVHAQSIKSDTQALATSVKAVRGKAGLGADEFRTIHKAFLEWVDGRLRNRVQVAALNRELRDAGAFGAGQHIGKAHQVNYTGLLEEVGIVSIADGLLAVRLGIGTTCSYDETIALYQRQRPTHIGWLSHGDIENGVGYVFSSFEVGEKEADGKRIIASAEYSNWCTSTLIRANFRINRVEGTSLKSLLNRDLDARRDIYGQWDSPPVTAAIEGNTVTFHYFRTAPGAIFAKAVQSYVVTTDRATPLSQLP